VKVRVHAGNKELGEFELCSSFLSRFRGLMFRRSPARLLFIFPSTAPHPIHSLFVFFPFDAVFLDEQKRVVGVRKGIAPFTPFIAPPQPIKYLLEFPQGESVVRDGQRLEWR